MTNKDRSHSLDDDTGSTSPKSGTFWSRSPGITVVVIGTCLVASIILLSLAITSATQVYGAPLDKSLFSYPSDFRWPVGWYVAYFIIGALVSTVYSLLDLTLYILARRKPWFALLGSSVLIVGLIVQLAFWLQCDLTPDYNQCQQFYLVQVNRTSLSGAIPGVSTDITYTRITLGFMLITLYAINATLAAIAAYRRPKAHPPQASAAKKTPESSLHRDPHVANNNSINVSSFYA